MPRAVLEKAEPVGSATQVEATHLTVWPLLEDRATAMGECWPYKADATLESTVGRLGGRVRVAEGPRGCTEGSRAADVVRSLELLRAHAKAPCGLHRHGGCDARGEIPPFPEVQAWACHRFLKIPVASAHCWFVLRRNQMQYVINVALDDGRRRCLEDYLFWELHSSYNVFSKPLHGIIGKNFLGVSRSFLVGLLACGVVAPGLPALPMASWLCQP